ncbi:MAG: hypothetical protein AAB974_03540 [Patescibacteria group bacterium]
MSEHNEVTTGEIMEFLKDHMVTREDFDARMAEMGVEMRKMKVEILDGVDDKITNLKGDLIVLMRKEDRKVITLIGLLREKQVISEEEAKSLLGMEPFPQVLTT